MKMENGFKRKGNTTPVFVDTCLPQTRSLWIVQKVNLTRLFRRRKLLSAVGEMGVSVCHVFSATVCYTTKHHNFIFPARKFPSSLWHIPFWICCPGQMIPWQFQPAFWFKCQGNSMLNPISNQVSHHSEISSKSLVWPLIHYQSTINPLSCQHSSLVVTICHHGSPRCSVMLRCVRPNCLR